MKMLLFFYCVITILCNSFGQEPIEADLLLSVDSVQTNEIRFISCGSSVFNNNPLFIIDGIPYSISSNNNFSEVLSPKEIISIFVLKESDAITLYGSASKNGVVIVRTHKYPKPDTSRKRYPFKVYEVCNSDWTIPQDMFNAIRAKVPGLTIDNGFGVSTPKINIRGDNNPIVIVDGIRYDASILNTLNPADIESVSVAPSIAATNYFINN